MTWPYLDHISIDQRPYLPRWNTSVRKDTTPAHPLADVEVVLNWAEKIAIAKEAREAGIYIRRNR